MAKAQTVLVTGASGFIAKHIVLKLLKAGYNARGSIRSDIKAGQVRAAMEKHLPNAKNLDSQLSFVTLDLLSDEGWGDALKGVDAMLHTASPFPDADPKDENDLIRPAVDGTLRALNAAQKAGVKRVVLTSSFAAVGFASTNAGKSLFNEDDWTDVNNAAASPYVRSKTLAEKAAWDFVTKNPDIRLSTVNPVLVLGPALDTDIGTSLALVQRIMNGKDPMMPDLGFAVVDVRDVAEIHVRALESAKAEGKRFIAANGFMWFAEIADVLRKVYPDGEWLEGWRRDGCCGSLHCLTGQ